jgi:hypothetical protein
MFTLWMKSALDGARFCEDVQQVIALRIIKLSRGGTPARREARRMVTEKGIAFTEAGLSLAAGASMQKVARRYRSRVSANKRRLSK